MTSKSGGDFYSQGFQAGSMRATLLILSAAAMRDVTLDCPPSNWARSAQNNRRGREGGRERERVMLVM